MMTYSYLVSHETDPYENIALEECLLRHVGEQEVILYLWQNRKTVVIGYNQNPWRECKVEQLTADGGHLVRRLSGGGAVFHDLGNLNFTFVARKQNYDVARQSEVILRAVRSFGIPAVRNGRNDLTADGRKFSGNAFYRTGDRCYHHGTILLRADKAEMSRYLTVSKEKLQSKGVESVRSRVVNLEEYVPELTVEELEQALIRAFGEVYGGSGESRSGDDGSSFGRGVHSGDSGNGRLEVFARDRLPADELQASRDRFASWEWLYGRRIPFQYETAHRFSWGELVIQTAVSGGIVDQIAVWSDGLDVEFPGKLEALLKGCVYQKQPLMQRIEASGWTSEYKEQAIEAVQWMLEGGDANDGDDI
ncbi:MAG: lipoate--protein ligase [Lachnospiraceae bacterium]|nr:lipoate--protein ligase [Lachnospiraceae bacterium]